MASLRFCEVIRFAYPAGLPLADYVLHSAREHSESMVSEGGDPSRLEPRAREGEDEFRFIL